MTKSVTCATLVQFEDTILGCHVTGQSFWDLPKGLNESYEVYDETAIRELHEETGISLPIESLCFIAYDRYSDEKDIALYWVKLSYKPVNLACSSTFVNERDVYLPEVDDYYWFTLDQFMDKTSKVMSTFLSNNYSSIIARLT